MKKWPLKIKLTVLYTALMALVTVTALGILISLSRQEMLASVQTVLREQVHRSIDDITPDRDRLEIDSDFYDLEGGVYLSVYSEEGTFLYGRVPYGFNSGEALRDGQVRMLSAADTDWYMYNALFDLEPYGTVYIRGVVSVADAENSTAFILRLALVILPLLVAVTAFLVYRMTRRTLLPVRQITETVQKIRNDADLSRRVALGQGRDEIYQLAGTFDSLLAELETAFQREKQFTSDVSHELRTPLTVILNQCGAMLEGDNLTEKERQEIQVIQKKASDMARLISQLLLLSRADQGRQPLHLERLSLSELTQITVEEQAELAGACGLTLTARIQEGILAEADETLYIRMLNNLLSNAVSYSRPCGHISVELSCQDGMAVGCVADDGIGIAPEDLPHVFERFYRADNSRTDSGHSGLGLSMVQWIAKAHGGGVSAESSPGKGSRFTFFLPLLQKKDSDSAGL